MRLSSLSAALLLPFITVMADTTTSTYISTKTVQVIQIVATTTSTYGLNYTSTAVGTTSAFTPSASLPTASATGSSPVSTSSFIAAAPTAAYGATVGAAAVVVGMVAAFL